MSFYYPYFPAQLTDGQPGVVEYSITTASTATFPSHLLPLFFFFFLRLIFRGCESTTVSLTSLKMTPTKSAKLKIKSLKELFKTVACSKMYKARFLYFG
jgi:hypothetical protein